METTTVDRAQLKQLVKGELPAEETAVLCTLVSSDPAVARAYVEVKLEHEHQCRCESAAAAAAAASPPTYAKETVEVPVASAPATVPASVAPISVGHAALYFVVAAVLSFALMGLMVRAWS